MSQAATRQAGTARRTPGPPAGARDWVACPQPYARSWLMRAAWMVACVLASVLLYSPSFSGGFVFDDRYQFYTQPADPGPWSNYLRGPRPLVQLSYLLSHALSGADPEAFRLVSAVGHGVNATLAGLLVSELSLVGGVAPTVVPALGFAAGLLFLAHPLQTEAVAYIAARTDVFCAFFFLLALLLFVRLRDGGRMPWTGVGAIGTLFLLALASKEHAAGLAGVMLALEAIHRRRWGGWRSGHGLRLYAFLGIVGLLGGLFIAHYLSNAKTIGSGAGASPLAYAITQWRSIARYLQLVVWPAGLNFDYDWPLSHTPFEYGAWGMLAMVMAVVAAVIRWRDPGGLVLTGMALAALTLAPTSTFIPLADRIAERRMYLPMAGVALALAGLAVRGGLGARTIQTGAILLAALAAATTHQRAAVWGSPVRLWQDTVSKSPRKFRPHYWLARSFFESGQCRQAAVEFVTADARRGPDDDPFDLEIALAQDCAGDLQGAASTLERFLARDPNDPQAIALRGRLRIRQGDTEAGLRDLDRALELDPAQPAALAARGETRLALQQWEDGIADLEKALAVLGPDARLVVLLDKARRQLAVEKNNQAMPRDSPQ